MVTVEFVLEYNAKSLSGKGKGKAACLDDIVDSGQNWDAVCYKRFEVETEGGTNRIIHIQDRSLWMEREILFLMVFRCSAADQFKEACQTPKKHSIMSLWEDLAEQLPKEDGKKQKTGKECQWMWNMLLRDFTNVLTGKKSPDAFPYFRDMQNEWASCRA